MHPVRRAQQEQNLADTMTRVEACESEIAVLKGEIDGFKSRIGTLEAEAGTGSDFSHCIDASRLLIGYVSFASQTRKR